MFITEIKTQNVKKIRFIQIEANGHVTVEGKNGNGKSSTLDSIEYALGGTAKIPKDVKNNKAGEKDPVETVLKLSPDSKGNEWHITRHWTTSGNTALKVQNQDGLAPTSTQTFLNSLSEGKLIFDPIGFMHADPKDQVERLKSILKLDFTKQNQDYKKYYEERTAVNSKVNLLKGQVEKNKDLVKPGKCRTLEDVAADRGKIKEHNEKLKKQRDNKKEIFSAINTANSNIESLLSNISINENQLAEIQEKLEKQKKLLVQEKESIIKYRRKHDEMLDIPKDQSEEDLDKETAEINRISTARTNWDNAQDTQKDYEAAIKEAEGLNKKIDDIKADVKKQMEDAKMPIKGLTLDGNMVYFNGIALAEAAQSEQIKVTMAIAMVGNPQLRVILIRTGSLLDSESMDYIKAIATKYNFQLWIERVADKPSGEENSFFIEEGYVKGQNEKTGESL